MAAIDMTTETDIKQQVREFYNQVGWQEVSEGVYQNARYEDLRPVSRDYIHGCHLRVARHLKPQGKFLLDVGSGPIQYPEYLEYSRGYDYRVCADISHVALQEARKRIGEHGLFVVMDAANLPFKPDTFDGLVSLHTIHHLPESEHIRTYKEFFRVLMPGCQAAVVNGWRGALIPRILNIPLRWIKAIRQFVRILLRREAQKSKPEPKPESHTTAIKGTFVKKYDAHWLKEQLTPLMPLEIFVWRSVSVRHLRAFIHARLGGRGLLRFLFLLEEKFPRFFGEKGLYPLIVITKVGS
jgi:ubiquinone/menaquinone biosynthesis C-methylase UbiE